MKNFEFRLATVLRLREVQLNAQTAKLQALLLDNSNLQKRIDQLRSERAESVEWVRDSPDVTSLDLRTLSAFSLGSRSREATLQQSIEDGSKEIAQQRSLVMQAERNCKLLIKLREKKLAAWKYASDRELEALAQEAWQSLAHRQKEAADKFLASNS